MEAVMAVSPERTAELVALLEKALGLTPRLRPKPKVVVNEEEVVRDADVRVSPTDPNYRESDGGMVRVRRTDFVTIRMDHAAITEVCVPAATGL
jgi:hypothetical protein